MRFTKLIGVLFLVGGLFVTTRGTGWHAGYVAGGLGLIVLGLLMLSRRRRHLQLKQVYRTTRPLVPHNRRVRV